MRWIPISEMSPKPGQKVLALGRKTLCCDLDADEEWKVYEAIFEKVLSSYKKDSNGNRIEEIYTDFFKLGDEFHQGYLWEVGYWMPWIEVVKMDNE